MYHEPCASHGDCYHARGGRIGGLIGGHKNVESGQLTKARKRAQKIWNGSSRNLQILSRVNSDPRKTEWSAIGGRKNVESGHLVRARKRARETWIGSLENKAQLTRIRKLNTNPSKEEINRLHNRLPGWNYNIHVDPKDGGNEIEVDAFRGKVCAFYDGVGKYKKNPKLHGFEEKQRQRLTDTGYFVRAVFNRAPNDAEILQWNILAGLT